MPAIPPQCLAGEDVLLTDGRADASRRLDASVLRERL